MANAHIEFAESITPARVEYAYGLAMKMQMARNQGFADTGWRAALHRDAKLLKALEKGAEIVGKMSEDQTGRTRRSPDATIGERTEHTESQLWREAYRLCDEGNPIRNFEWIYACAAWLCGYNG